MYTAIISGTVLFISLFCSYFLNIYKKETLKKIKPIRSSNLLCWILFFSILNGQVEFALLSWHICSWSLSCHAGRVLRLPCCRRHTGRPHEENESCTHLDIGYAQGAPSQTHDVWIMTPPDGSSLQNQSIPSRPQTLWSKNKPPPLCLVQIRDPQNPWA